MNHTTMNRGVHMPPLQPRTIGGKIAVSCERPGVWLIRAWTPRYREPGRLVGWILHHVGRVNMDGLEWWGMTYPGQPPYMGWNSSLTSGLTIQRLAPEAGTSIGWTIYGPPEDLDIPERGVVR